MKIMRSQHRKKMEANKSNTRMPPKNTKNDESDP